MYQSIQYSYVMYLSIRRVLYRIETCTWGLSNITHSLATLGRALYLNNTLAIARVLFKHNERYAHVLKSRGVHMNILTKV